MEFFQKFYLKYRINFFSIKKTKYTIFISSQRFFLKKIKNKNFNFMKCPHSSANPQIINTYLQGFKFLGAGLATIGLVGAGVGVGLVFGLFLVAYSNNASLKDDLFKYAILGFALTEAVGLLALMMAFLIYFA
jgi:F-type H+-transporting ATPase subunit c